MKMKELNYYDEFIKINSCALEATTILKEYIENFNYDLSLKKVTEIHTIENEADDLQHGILTNLIKDFVTPIDRDDIIELSHRTDDLVDNIDEVAINLDIFDVIAPREDVKKFTELLYKCCIILKEMCENFKNPKKYDNITDLIITINGLEEEGDKLYQEAIRNLYKTEQNAIEISKWTTIYNCLENCFDSCEYIADSVHEVIMKSN